jgi:hypothetical protein
MMKKKAFLTASLTVLGFLFLIPLQAMESEDKKKLNGIKPSTVHNRSQRDNYIQLGYDLNAAFFAIRVINEDPETRDNEDATIEDFRYARDIFSRLAKLNNDKKYLDEATAYAEDVVSLEAATQEDYIFMRDLYLKQGVYKNTAIINDLLPENPQANSKK